MPESETQTPEEAIATQEATVDTHISSHPEAQEKPPQAVVQETKREEILRQKREKEELAEKLAAEHVAKQMKDGVSLKDYAKTLEQGILHYEQIMEEAEDGSTELVDAEANIRRMKKEQEIISKMEPEQYSGPMEEVYDPTKRAEEARAKKVLSAKEKEARRMQARAKMMKPFDARRRVQPGLMDKVKSFFGGLFKKKEEAAAKEKEISAEQQYRTAREMIAKHGRKMDLAAQRKWFGKAEEMEKRLIRQMGQKAFNDMKSKLDTELGIEKSVPEHMAEFTKELEKRAKEDKAA